MKPQDETACAVGFTGILCVVGVGLIIPQMSELWMAVTIMIMTGCGICAFAGWLTLKVMREIDKSRRQTERVEALLLAGSHLRRVK